MLSIFHSELAKPQPGFHVLPDKRTSRLGRNGTCCGGSRIISRTALVFGTIVMEI